MLRSNTKILPFAWRSGFEAGAFACGSTVVDEVGGLLQGISGNDTTPESTRQNSRPQISAAKWNSRFLLLFLRHTLFPFL